MILALQNPAEFLLNHVTDHPWPGCAVKVGGMQITWMSSAIASMLLVAAVLCVWLTWRVRRARRIGCSAGVVEVLVLFVRDQIAVPALGDRAHVFLPMLLSLFVFVLGMNLISLVPLEALCHAIPGNVYLIGAAPTSVLTVCAALASLTLIVIVATGLWRSARELRHGKGLPVVLCILAAPLVWLMSFAPSIPGVTGKILLLPMVLLEVLGALAKCFALMIRIFANMLAGHFLLAVVMMFIVQTSVASFQSISSSAAEKNIHAFYVAPICIAASVLVDMMELLVAGLQAYIYTFLTALFIGLYAEHSLGH